MEHVAAIQKTVVLDWLFNIIWIFLWKLKEMNLLI
jgi:hypothetical protein